MANEAPCPNCGAPSPLLEKPQQAGWGTGAQSSASWGGPEMQGGTPYGGQWEQPQVPQMPFNTAAAPWQSDALANSAATHSWQADPNPMPSWQQPSGQYNPMPSWQQQPSGQLGAQNGAAQPDQQSMLPVPYQGGTDLQPGGRQSTISLQLVPQQAVEHLLPAEPLSPDVVHVPPMFTKPRPIVPKYRVISGLLSVIIVTLLLCTGASYYAKASGTWDRMVSLYTGTSPVKSVPPDDVKIPDPPARTDKDSGPAQMIIPSASLAANIDKNYQPIQAQTIFQPGQKFYLTLSVQPPKGQEGKVTAKWFTNGKSYMPITLPGPIKYNATNIQNSSIQMQFPNKLSGYVEIYWNNQFAQRLYFAIR
ncbi:hypothetical protein [Dictyobacter alpinus]|uniref:hypothetical protein n=1 Tax=Dictyobacter alpinus TaxID=2014873 RepID=UPI000F82619F|nr:hypothetical protein [Dictyobacter alpinus]